MKKTYYALVVTIQQDTQDGIVPIDYPMFYAEVTDTKQKTTYELKINFVDYITGLMREVPDGEDMGHYLVETALRLAVKYYMEYKNETELLHDYMEIILDNVADAHSAVSLVIYDKEPRFI